jgi:transposase
VTINAVLKHLRRKKPTEAHTEDLDGIATNTEASHELAADDASLLGAIDRLTLRRALHKLPVGYRKYFLLHDVIGYKHGEIAKILQCSIGCSKSQLHKARRRLRDLLQENRGGASPRLSLLEIANCPECFGCSGGIVLGRLQVRSHGLFANEIARQVCIWIAARAMLCTRLLSVTGEDPRPTRPGH